MILDPNLFTHTGGQSSVDDYLGQIMKTCKKMLKRWGVSFVVINASLIFPWCGVVYLITLTRQIKLVLGVIEFVCQSGRCVYRLP